MIDVIPALTYLELSEQLHIALDIGYEEGTVGHAYLAHPTKTGQEGVGTAIEACTIDP
jgi:hypothetical protein